MSNKKHRHSTPKQSSMIDWLTTPPLKHIQVLPTGETNSSPTCLFDPSPVHIKSRKTSGDKATFLDLLHSVDHEKKDTETTECPIAADSGDEYFEELQMDLNFSAIESASQAVADLSAQGFLRFMVLEVQRSVVDNTEQLQVLLLNEKTGNEQIMILVDDWLDCPILPGKYVHLVVDGIPAGNIHIDNQNGLLVTDPDELISVTSLADSFQCLRRSVLNWKVRFTGTVNASMLHGTLLHSLFQEALLCNDYSTAYLESRLKLLIDESIESLYAIGQSEQQCYTELVKFVPMLQNWYDGNCKKPNQSCPKPFRIVRAVEVEDRVWSPKFGVKGNIDVTAQVEYSRSCTGSTIVPLELKTGKRQSIAHRAQTTIYTLMLSDKYSQSIDDGLLVYLQSGETIQVPSVKEEYRSILLSRNRFAHFATRSELPEIIDNEFTCSKCFCSDLCLLSHKVLEGGNEKTSKLPGLFLQKTASLNEVDTEFIRNWERMITAEESKSRATSKDIWTLDATEREKKGTSIGNLELIEIIPLAEAGRFQSQAKFINQRSDRASFLDSSFNEGDPVIVLKEYSRHPSAIGIIQSMTTGTVIVLIDKPISRNDNRARKVKYSIEKDSFSNGLSLVRGNLYGMFLEGSNPRLRDLIVRLETPRFNEINDTVLDCVRDKLNQDQQNAIIKSLGCRDYSLILGMPGTGKTSTIVHLIRLLVQKGKSVLYTSYTHSAVDNLLLKLLDSKLAFLRVGSFGKMHPRIREYAKEQRDRAKDFQSLSRLYNQSMVVATTALGINEY
jgi:DNA replication ATP-dependent helicase Dna2